MRPALLFAVGVLALLPGCHTLSTAPDRVEVPTPVIQPCVQPSDIPAKPESRMVPGTNVERLAAGVSATLRESELYAQQLLALLRGCTETESAQ